MESLPVQHSGAPKTAEDWAALPEDLPCPRCGYNLRMQTGSRCPECGVEFDWARIVRAALLDTNSPLFEYRWKRQFVRSYFHTTLALLRPFRFWKRLPLEYSPRVGGLLLYLVASVLMFLTYGMTIGLLSRFATLSRYWRRRDGVLEAIVNDIMHQQGRMTRLWFEHCLLEEGRNLLFGLIVAVLVPVFWQTRRTFRIRNDLILRLAVYSLVASRLLLLLLGLCLFLISLAIWPKPGVFPTVLDVPLYDVAQPILFICAFGGGLVLHARVKHGWATAFLLSVVALLLLLGVAAIASQFTVATNERWFVRVQYLTRSMWVWPWLMSR